MFKDTVERLVDQSLEKRPDLFLVKLTVNPDYSIRVTLDGDQPVSVDDCVEISREIEGNLDREKDDFSLEVMSAGVTAPLELPRQYMKNVGRKLKVRTLDNRYKANLIHADENEIELQWKQREPKPTGKGKHTVQKQVKLPYNEIKEATVMITFK